MFVHVAGCCGAPVRVLHGSLLPMYGPLDFWMVYFLHGVVRIGGLPKDVPVILQLVVGFGAVRPV